MVVILAVSVPCSVWLISVVAKYVVFVELRKRNKLPVMLCCEHSAHAAHVMYAWEP